MKTVEYGNTVRIHYTAKLEDDRILTTTRNTDPLQFTVGADHVIRDIEQAVISMQIGESKHIAIPGNSLFGPCRENNFIEFRREELPQYTLTIGSRIKIPGQRFSVKVTNISESTVTVDANHPLCGTELLFDITLLAIL